MLQDVQRAISNAMFDCEEALWAWDHVEVVTKKNGKPFSDMAKNFKNASYTTKGMVITKAMLTVVYHSHNGNDEDAISFFNSEPSSVEEIVAAIEKRKQELRERSADYKHQLSLAKDAYNAYKAKLDEAYAALEDACGSDRNLLYCEIYTDLADYRNR